MTHSLRHVNSVASDTTSVTCEIDALPVIELPGTPGWLTGEPLEAQGVEVAMPNLPREITLPEANPKGFVLKVDALGDDAVRVRLAQVGHRVLQEELEWLGIVVDTPAATAGWSVTEDDAQVLIAGPRVGFRIGKSPFTLELLNAAGERLLRTAQRLRQVAGFPMAPPVLFSEDGMTINLELDVDENILGFGEQFSRLVKNGQLLRLHTEDALGTGTGMAYKPVPVWHSTNGYLAFINTGAELIADIGHRRPSVLSVEAKDSALDLVLIAESDPKARLLAYTQLTGRAGVPPLWAFGYWMGRCRYHSREEMLEVADTLRELEVPADVLHCDPDWLILDRLNTDFFWNEDRFGPLKEFCDALDERDFRLSVWEVPYLDPRSARFAEAKEKGFLLKTPDGEIAELRGTPTPDGLMRGLVDFSNPAAKSWWQELHQEFLEAGVDVFKTDFGEGCPNVVDFGDIPTEHAHNLYTLYYNGAVYDGIGKYTDRNPLVWGRSAWAGSQRYPGQWGGDAESTVVGMQATLRGGLSYAMCAPGFWSHDIGGFFGPELTPGLYVRWTQFGALSPLARAHGLRPREPWEFGDVALRISREWIKLRYSLLPYLWQAGNDCAELGLPMLRPLALEFPADPIAVTMDDEYLLGHDLLVVPIFSDTMDSVNRRFYVPEGRWHDFVTGEVVEGPRFMTREVSIEEMPILVRDGAVIPRIDVSGLSSTVDAQDRDWELHVWGDVSPTEKIVTFDGVRRSLEELESGGWRLVRHL